MPTPKILVVEDDLVTAKVLRLNLERLGYSVIHVTEASDAARVLRVDKPDVIILDINLPETDPFSGPHWDGVAFVNWMKRMTEVRVPIVIYSGYDPLKLEPRLNCPEVIGIFQKPDRLNDVLFAVRDVLDRRPSAAA